MTEDQQNNQQQQQSSPKEQRKTSIHDMRNQDFVSRLLAATPPYLYSAPVGPNNFFFSDMLRSLVQAKNNENARNIQLQQAALARRPRKRSWSSQQHRPYELLKERRELEEKNIEKPLELTTCKQQIFPIASKYSKNILDSSKENSHMKISSGHQQQQQHLQQSGINLNENKLNEFHSDLRNDSTPLNQVAIPDSPSSSVLSTSDQVAIPPPPPPVWYPPIYSPYGIDPLHFFIDLRVSGHIYDRKKDNSSPLNNKSDNSTSGNLNENETIGKYRHGSAFTVPLPRNESKTTSAINLSTSSNNNNNINNLDNIEKYNKYYNICDSKENLPNAGKTTNYVLQNLPRLYAQVNTRDSDDNKSDKEEDDVIDNQEQHNRAESGLIDVELNPEDEDIIHQID